MRAVIYCRVSTDAQERDGTSLETQERACQEHAKANGWRVVETLRDTASGYHLERPGVERLRALLRQGSVDVVVAHAVDRMSRNQNHIGVLFDEAEQAGVRLEFVTERFEDTAIGRFILAARAFIAEVEREKIAERTMRGKAERARSGRLPQATGKGIFGYRYIRESGKREVEPCEAAVVRRIFERYLETRSFSAVSHELNQAGVPAFSGGRWYPLTIRRVLTNEAYTGRTVYRRTKRVRVRTNGQRRSQVVQRPPEEWIDVEGASPRLMDDATWLRVQEIIQDPERIRRRPSSRGYLLSGRLKCGVCGAAVVGQTMAVKGRSYRYYRCRHAYDRNSGRSCPARYIRADGLEVELWRHVKQVLADPGIVLAELSAMAPQQDPAEVSAVEQQLRSLKEQEKRLVRLFTYGEVDDDAVRHHATLIRQRGQELEAQLRNMERHPVALDGDIDQDAVARACRRLREWLDSADEGLRINVLEALQLTLQATRDSASAIGVLPSESPPFITDDGSCPCSFNGDPAIAPAFPVSFRFPIQANATEARSGHRADRRTAVGHLAYTGSISSTGGLPPWGTG